MNLNNFKDKIREILANESTNQSRKQLENQLEEYKKQYPDLFIQFLCQLLQGTIPNITFHNCLKTLTLKQIQGISKHLSSFNEKRIVNIWPQLSKETQTKVKNTLSELVKTEQNKIIRHQLCNTIGELGGNLLDLEDISKNQWPELLSFIWSLIQSSQNSIIESGLLIIGSLIQFYCTAFLKYKAELYSVFTSGIQSQEKDIKIASMKAMQQFISCSDRSETLQFQNLILLYLQEMYQLLKSDELLGQESLQLLQEMCESEPKFFKKHFHELFTCLHKISFDKQLEESNRRLAVEIMLNLTDRLPQSFKDNKFKQIDNSIEMIFSQMVEIDQNIEESWKVPPEGYNEDFDKDSENESIRFGTNGIDRMITNIGAATLLPILSNIVGKMFQQQDWRFQFAAIMALSQVGEYITNIKEIEPILHLIIQYKSNQNAKIRYATMHCLGQIADDMEEEFQDSYHSIVMPVLIELLNDEIPRVQSHAAAAITNMTESMSQDVMKQYLHNTITKLFSLLNNTPSIVKETVLSAIATVAETAQSDFKQYFHEAMPYMFNFIELHSGDKYRQLRGQVIECITLMSHAVVQLFVTGYEEFQKYEKQLILLMLNLQNQKTDANDPQKSYLLSGWQRLCIIMKQNFSTYINDILPSVFNVIEELFKECVSDDTDQNINTTATENAEVAIQMIKVIIEEMKGSFIPYLEKTTELILPFLKYTTNESLRQSASQSLPVILKTIKVNINESNVQVAVKVAKIFINSLWSAINNEAFPIIMQEHINSLKHCLDFFQQKFLEQQEVDDFCQKIKDAFTECEKRKKEADVSSYLNSDGAKENLDEEEIEEMQEDIDSEEDFLISVSQIIGSLYKNHSNEMLPFADFIYNNYLNFYMQEKKSVKSYQLGIFFIDDMMEHLPFNFLINKLQNMLQCLLQYATSTHLELRQAAVYGIGIIAQICTQSNSQYYTQEVASICLQKLKQSLDVKMQNDQKPKVYGGTQDNVMAAIGKIIKYQSEKIQNLEEIIQLWFSYLPMKYDKNEAKIQHQMLLEILEIKPELILGKDLQNLSKTIHLFAFLLQQKNLINDTIKNGICKQLINFNNSQQIQQKLNEALSALTESQTKQVNDIILQYQQSQHKN